MRFFVQISKLIFLSDDDLHYIYNENISYKKISLFKINKRIVTILVMQVIFVNALISMRCDSLIVSCKSWYCTNRTLEI